MRRRSVLTVAVLALASCSGEWTSRDAAEHAAGPGASCVAARTEAMCTREAVLLHCDIDGVFTFTARCHELATLTGRGRP